jgi:hypothetical protein
MDKECSLALQEYFHHEDITLQLVPPGIHRANAAERAIKTLKKSHDCGLVHHRPRFSTTLVESAGPAIPLTLNLLRASILNSKLSAYAQVFGQYSYQATPIAPPFTHFLMHEKTPARESWAPHAVDAWYVGPALNHYRCYRGWVCSTQRECI